MTLLYFGFLGVGTGALYAAFSLSVIISYRGSGVLNFAVGAMAMIPAMTFAELRTSGDLVLPVVGFPNRFAFGDPPGAVLAAVIALAVGLVVAVVVYLLIVRPLRRAPALNMLVATVGLTLVLQAIAVKGFGNRTIRADGVLSRDVVTFFGRPYPVDRLWVLGAVVVLAVAVAMTYRHTRFGLATRAAFLNEKGSILLGLNPARLGIYNWLFAALLAGSVGVLGASLGGVNPFNYSVLVVPALGAALAARLRSIPVAVAVAVAIGCFEAIAIHLVAQRQVPRFFLGGISSLVPFVAIVAALWLVGKALPNRAAILDRAHVRMCRDGIRPVLWVPVIGVGAASVLSDDPTVRFAAMQTLFVVTLLLSIVVLTGMLGQVSLAQLSFAGVAAFTLSWADGFLPFPLAPLFAVAVTTLIGTAVSIPALRVRGGQFAIVTFSTAVVLDDLLFRSPTLVSSNGLAGVRHPRLFGVQVGIDRVGEFPSKVFGLGLLITTVACSALVVGIRSGGVGRRFLAVRSNERAAASVGVSVARTKVMGAALASLLAGVAGVMFAYKSVMFNGAGLDAQEGLELLALVFVGGIGSIAGAVIGGILAPSGLFFASVLGGGSSINQFLLTGCALILVAVRFPSGLAGSVAALRRARLAGNEPSTPSRASPDAITFAMTPHSEKGSLP